MIVDADKNVVALDWVYTNEDGQVANQHRLETPYGDRPLEEVTAPVALLWLKEQSDATAEKLDAAIASHKQQVEYEQGLSAYTVNVQKAPTKITPVEEETEVSTMPVED